MSFVNLRPAIFACVNGRFIFRACRQWWLVALLVLALIRASSAGPFSQLVVFGDSLSDIGNISQATFGTNPGRYYFSGRYSNGPNYVDALATGLGLSMVPSTANGNDFAYGGAKTSGTSFPTSLVVQDVDDQVSIFLSKLTNHKADPNALYLIFAGANDLIDGQTTMTIPVNSLGNQIGRLISAGAQNFLVLNLPLLGYTPRFNSNPSDLATYNTRSQQFNSTLATKLDNLVQSNPTITMYRFDVAGLFNQALTQPAVFGLTNVTASAAPGLSPGASSYNGPIASNADQYMFWDDLHPTTTVDGILARHMLQLFTTTANYNQNNVVDAADYVLWRKELGSAYTQDYYNDWHDQFGQSKSAGAAEFGVTAPEPGSVLLVLVGVAAILCRRSTFLKGNSRTR